MSMIQGQLNVCSEMIKKVTRVKYIHIKTRKTTEQLCEQWLIRDIDGQLMQLWIKVDVL